MNKKSVHVDTPQRSTPSSPAWQGPGNKPGPKNVPVKQHGRRPPK